MNAHLFRRSSGAMFFSAVMLVAQSSFGALVLNYQFEEVFGDVPTQTTKDSAGNYADAVNLVGGPGTTPGVDYPQQLTGSNLVANATVKSLNPSSYMQFTGPNAANNNSARVRIPDANTGVLDTTLTNFTFATWVKPTFVPDDAATDRLIAAKIGGSTPAANHRGWLISSPPQQPTSITGLDGSLIVSGGDDLLVAYFPTPTSVGSRNLVVQDVLPLNTWTHIAFTFDGTAGTEAVYINGVAASFTVDPTGGLDSVPATLNGSNAGSFMAGTLSNSGSQGRLTGIYGWVGGLDDLRIYDQTLTAAEVQALVAPVTQAHAGDFDGDGDVDGADFVAWQTHFPTASGATLAQGDADGDGDVDGADFVVWQTNFPFTPGPGVAPVPEPTGICLLGIGAIGLVLAQRGRRKHN